VWVAFAVKVILPGKQILDAINDKLTVGVTMGAMVIGVYSVVPEADVLVKQVPDKFPTSTVTISPGLNVLGALISVLTGNDVVGCMEN
jgi:hypothetical protein